MTNVLVIVVAQLVGGAMGLQGVGPIRNNVPFSELPTECRAAYDADLLADRKQDGGEVRTQTIRADLNGDGVDELFAFTGESGSGGEGWVCYRKGANGTFREVGRLFGSLWKVPNGVLERHRLGWSGAVYTYYELTATGLKGRFRIETESVGDGAGGTRLKEMKIEVMSPVGQ